jgi:hypothetical protein
MIYLPLARIPGLLLVHRTEKSQSNFIFTTREIVESLEEAKPWP